MTQTDSLPGLDLLNAEDRAKARKDHVHIYANGAVCETDALGYATPDNMSVEELVLHAPNGAISLWAENTTLRWRFNEASMLAFSDPDAAKAAIRQLMAEALLAWGDAVPVKFSEQNEFWDFELVVRAVPDCDANGCVLARAFFPDAGRHELILFPTLFGQSRQEMVETMAHEFGHVFGLRHFFAQISEAGLASEIFGTHDSVSIMNYGPDSRLTDADRRDLKALYAGVWSGALTHVNGTPVRTVTPFSHAFVPQPSQLATLLAGGLRTG